MRRLLGLTIAAFLLAPLPVLAWGPEGHEIVAAIAADSLSAAANAQVSAILGGGARNIMVLDSTWADEVRTDRPETSGWHFVNIELGSTGYDSRRDCGRDDCVVAQIERDTRLVGDTRQPLAVRRDALRFLIHFVGDVHQPLHAADRHDRGGNALTVSYRGQRASLHHIWDQDVVSALGEDPMRVAADIAGHITPAEKSAMARGTPADWANESFTIAARDIYARLPASGTVIRLPENYAAAQRAIVRGQLARAGVRLAMLLNATLR